MKKLLALLLVLCMAIGLMACTGTPDPTDPSKEDPKPSESQNANDPEPTESKAPEKPFKGKTLQVWGVAQGDYADIEKIKEKTGVNYLYLHNAQIAEWAAINEVTIEHIPSYNQNAILAAMNGGDKPDVINVLYNQYPISRNLGIVKELTDEQRAEIDDIIGSTTYTDLVSKGKKAYGFVMPWQGVESVWFNDTLFKTYGAKTPHDYIKEGNWTWETLVQCMKDTTKDVDGDGTFDIYGMDLRGINRMLPNFEEDKDGKLINIIDTERQREFITLIYNGMKEGYIQALNYTYSRVDYPRPAMFIGDGGVSDYGCFYDDRLENGEILMRAPSPIRSKEDPYHLNCITSIYWAMGAATDEPEAAWDLFKYITLTGMTFRYDGYYESIHPYEKPKYYEEGKITGVSELGAAFVEQCKRARKTSEEKMQNTIMPAVTKEQTDVIFPLLNKPYNEDPYFMINGYTGVTNYLSTAANYNNPPATMIATLKPTLDSQIATYNDLYVY